MITLISGTHRPDNRTSVVADALADSLKALGADARVVSLSEIRMEWFEAAMYSGGDAHPDLRALQKEYILGAKKMAFVVPEYNGSFPGVLKLFLDGLSVNDYADNFRGKRIALVGVASGRAGNLRGMDHLAEILAYMGAWVLPNKLPVSGVEGLIDDNDRLSDPETQRALTTLAQQLIDA